MPISFVTTVIQELGREGILPFSALFASNKPFDAPLSGLSAQWLVTCTLVLAVPAGDAYLFMLNSWSSVPDLLGILTNLLLLPRLQ